MNKEKLQFYRIEFFLQEAIAKLRLAKQWEKDTLEYNQLTLSAFRYLTLAGKHIQQDLWRE